MRPHDPAAGGGRADPRRFTLTPDAGIDVASLHVVATAFGAEVPSSLARVSNEVDGLSYPAPGVGLTNSVYAPLAGVSVAEGGVLR